MGVILAPLYYIVIYLYTYLIYNCYIDCEIANMLLAIIPNTRFWNNIPIFTDLFGTKKQ